MRLFRLASFGQGGRASLAAGGLFFLVLAASPAHALDDPKEMLPNPQQEARAEAVGSLLRCLQCQNESIEDSSAPLAHDLRQIVREQVREGKTNRQIIDWMVARYGNFVRLRPPLTATTALLWATPFLGLIVGGGAAFLARRRRPAPPPPLTEAERARLEALTRPTS